MTTQRQAMIDCFTLLLNQLDEHEWFPIDDGSRYPIGRELELEQYSARLIITIYKSADPG